MKELVLAVIGRDRAGIVAKLAEAIRFHGGDWKRSELAEIEGTFAGVVVVELPADRVDELLTGLLILREQGLRVIAQEIESPSERPSADEVHIRLTGTDRPGVVQEVATKLGELGISIVRMGTVTDMEPAEVGTEFEFTARLSLPADVNVDTVIASVNGVASELGINLAVDELPNG